MVAPNLHPKKHAALSKPAVMGGVQALSTSARHRDALRENVLQNEGKVLGGQEAAPVPDHSVTILSVENLSELLKKPAFIEQVDTLIRKPADLTISASKADSRLELRMVRRPGTTMIYGRVNQQEALKLTVRPKGVSHLDDIVAQEAYKGGELLKFAVGLVQVFQEKAGGGARLKMTTHDVAKVPIPKDTKNRQADMKIVFVYKDGITWYMKNIPGLGPEGPKKDDWLRSAGKLSEMTLEKAKESFEQAVWEPIQAIIDRLKKELKVPDEVTVGKFYDQAVGAVNKQIEDKKQVDGTPLGDFYEMVMVSESASYKDAVNLIKQTANFTTEPERS